MSERFEQRVDLCVGLVSGAGSGADENERTWLGRVRLASIVLGMGLGMGIAAVSASPHEEVVLDVPFVQQPRNLCGAATVSMVLQYWHKQVQHGDDVPPLSEIAEALDSNRAGGVLGSDMRRYLKSRGFHAFAFEGSAGDLQDHIGRGRPLIVSLNRGATTHYVVVVGYNDADGYVYVNDPAVKKTLRLNRNAFEDDWAAAQSWTLIAVPVAEREPY